MIKSLHRFEELTDIIEEYQPELVDTLDTQVWETLYHMNDFESLEFIVIDDSTVLTIDSVNGDVYGSDPLNEFIQQAIEAANEER